MSANHSIFISLPFCSKKCAYCDLNAYAGLEDLIPAYAAALIKETQTVGQGTVNPVHTVYFGGGTPSLTPLPLLHNLLAAVRDAFNLTAECEISFEANPDSVDFAYLDGLQSLGINRLSLGAQSAQPDELALFGRTHTFADVIAAISAARRAGFQNISLDLIYGIPGQTLPRWQDTFTQALALAPDHFSVYALSLDFNTPLRAWVQRGLLAEPDDDLAAEMYEWADKALMQAGYAQYEISSWARLGDRGWGLGDSANPQPLSPNPRFQCRHNLQYWRNRPYLGLGAGAHGFCAGYRYWNVASPTAYIRRMESGAARPFPFSPALQKAIPVDRQTEMNETMLTGLRLVREGVSARAFSERYGVGVGEIYFQELKELEGRKLVEWGEAGVRLTPGGRLVANWVFEKFV